VNGSTVQSVLGAASGALRSGSVLVKDARAAWTMAVGSELLDLVADMVALGPGWTDQHADTLRLGVMNALVHVPKVQGVEARQIGGGISAVVTISRRWLAA